MIKVSEITWGVAVTTLLCIGIVGCNSKQDESFLGRLDSKADALIKEMKNARGTKKDELTVRSGDSVYVSEGDAPRMLWVASAAFDLANHFETVPLKTLLRLDSGNFDQWAEDVHAQVNYQRERLKKAVAKLESDVRNHPDKYPNSIIPELGFMYSHSLRIYGWSEDDHLYVIKGQKSVILHKLLDVNLDAWLIAVKAKVEEGEKWTAETLSK